MLKITDDNLDLLENQLPHGSGIDYAYELEIKNNTLIIKNGWHFMNDNGYYMTGFPFTVKIKLNSGIPRPDTMKLTFQIHSSWYYWLNKHAIREYLDELYYQFFEDYIL